MQYSDDKFNNMHRPLMIEATQKYACQQKECSEEVMLIYGTAFIWSFIGNYRNFIFP